MKITKKGTPTGEETWVGKCNKCGSEAECARSELTKYTPSDYKTEAFSWEACPVCGHGKKRNDYGGMLFRRKNEQTK
jgi:hypothetical protein